MIKQNGKYWHYRFMIDGRLFRGSTKETVKAKAQQYENRLQANIHENGTDAHLRKAPILSDYARDFLDRCEREVAAQALARTTWKYYRSGWKLLEAHRDFVRRRLNQITTHDAAVLTFPGGPSNANAAFRTLRRMLGSAVEAKLLRDAPVIKGVEEFGRNALIEPWIEKRLLAHAPHPLYEIIILMAGTGMRPEEVMRLEWVNVLWDRSTIAIPKAKTSRKTGQRYVPLTDRVRSLLETLRNGAQGPYVFPSGRAKEGHRTTVGRQWRETVAKANQDPGQPQLPEGLVLYCGRHTFATELLDESKNLKLVKDTLGHASVATTMKYLHPAMKDATELMNARDRRRAMALVERKIG